MSTTAKSKRELARRLGKSEATIRKWVKDPRWAAGSGPWDVEEVREWASLVFPSDAARPPGKKAAHRRKGGRRHGDEADDEEFDPDRPADGDDDLDPSAERRANIALKRERRATIRFEREVKQGKYVLKTDVQQVWMRIAHEMKTELLNIPETAVPAMQGLSEAEQRDVLRGRILEVLRHLAESTAAAEGGAA